jgi:dolichol-phosphate mannosyltransferase
MHPLVSVILPAKNEQGNIGKLIQEIHSALNHIVEFEIIVVDDGSTDNTVQEAISTGKTLMYKNVAAKESRGGQQEVSGPKYIEEGRQSNVVSVVSHSASCGQSTAVYTGVSHAKGEWIITSDADGQNDPADIPALIQAARMCKAPHFCIAGYRQKRLDTAWVRFQSKFANAIRQKLLDDGVPDSGCGLKLFPKHTFILLPYFDHMHRFLPALIKRLGGDIIVHPVNHRNRDTGRSNYNAWGRAWAGVIDLFGVLWLRKRAKYPQSITVHSEH